MKILLYGSKGFVGKFFVEFLSKKPEIEILYGNERCDSLSLKNEIKNYSPDRVVSLIGRTKGPSELNHLGNSNSTVDYLEDKIDINLRDNLFSPIFLERICFELGIHFTYIGTGCIYYSSLDDVKVYKEDDEPTFFGSQYSLVKGFTDKFFRYINSNMLNVRVRMPITEDKHSGSLLTKLLNYKKICKTSPNSMTVLEDLIPMLVNYVIEGNTGTLHLVNPGPMTHIEVLNLYKEIVDSSYEYELMDEEEQNKMLLSKRSVCILDSKETEQYGIPTLKDSLTRIFKSWKK